MSIPQSMSNLPEDPTAVSNNKKRTTVVFLSDRTLMNLFSLQGKLMFFVDGLKFNLMLVAKRLNRDKTNLRTKICGNFLTEQEQQGNCVTFVEDKDWMGANMAFAHVVRDEADDLMTVHLDKCESLESTI